MVTFQGLLESLSDGSLEQDPNIRMISLFDNEEVSVLRRLVVLVLVQSDRFCALEGDGVSCKAVLCSVVR